MRRVRVFACASVCWEGGWRGERERERRRAVAAEEGRGCSPRARRGEKRREGLEEGRRDGITSESCRDGARASSAFERDGEVLQKIKTEASKKKIIIIITTMTMMVIKDDDNNQSRCSLVSTARFPPRGSPRARLPPAVIHASGRSCRGYFSMSHSGPACDQRWLARFLLLARPLM